MLTQRKVAGAPTPTTPTMHTGQSHRPSLPTLYAICPKSQVARSSLIARVLDIADFALEQQRKLQQRAVLADDGEAQELRRRAQEWAKGREELLELAAPKEGGR